MIISNRKFTRHKRRRINLSRKKRRSPLNIKKASFIKKVFKIINIILAVVIVYFIYFFIFSSYYTITDIKVSELSNTSTGEFLELIDNHLNNYKFLGFKTKNYFLYKQDSLLKEINNSYLFDKIEIKKSLPNHLQVSVEEKNVIYRIYSYENEYLLDDAGQIVKKIANFANRPAILTVSGNTNDKKENSEDIFKDKISFQKDDRLVSLFTDKDIEFEIGEFITNQDQLNFIKEVVDYSNDNNFKIKRIIIPNKFPQYIEIETEQGWSIILNINDDYKNQIDKLNLVLKDQIGVESLNRLDYVDLRLGNNVYYKYKY